MDDADFAFWQERRRALLIEVHAIETRLQTQTVTVTVPRAQAEELQRNRKAQRRIINAVSN